MTPYEITPLHQFMADLYVAGMAIDVVTRLGYVFAESEYYSAHTEAKPVFEVMQDAAKRVRTVSQDLGLTIHQQGVPTFSPPNFPFKQKREINDTRVFEAKREALKARLGLLGNREKRCFLKEKGSGELLDISLSHLL